MRKKITNSIYQNNLQIVLSVCLVALVALVASSFSCTKRNPSRNPGVEEFYGTYMVRDFKLVEALAQQDSIHFTVYEDLRYSLDFYENANSNDLVDFCSNSGTLLDFGTPKASFGPLLIIYNACDSLSIPHGTFSADFINYGDTIILQRSVTDLNATKPYDSIFIMKLLK